MPHLWLCLGLSTSGLAYTVQKVNHPSTLSMEILTLRRWFRLLQRALWVVGLVTAYRLNFSTCCRKHLRRGASSVPGTQLWSSAQVWWSVVFSVLVLSCLMLSLTPWNCGLHRTAAHALRRTILMTTLGIVYIFTFLVFPLVWTIYFLLVDIVQSVWKTFLALQWGAGRDVCSATCLCFLPFLSVFGCLCRPFYRTEMLIITATNDTQWLHDTRFDNRLYGAVLEKDILHEVQTYVCCDVLLLWVAVLRMLTNKCYIVHLMSMSGCENLENLQGVFRKTSPPPETFWNIFASSMIAWNFANLLVIYIHVYLPIFVDLSLIFTINVSMTLF